MASLRRRLIGAVLAASVCLGLTVQADALPSYSVQQMCLDANLIVAGTHLGGGKVLVDRVFYAPGTNAKAGATINVPYLPRHTKAVGLGGRNATTLKTDRVVLFLRAYGDGTFGPIYTLGSGSQGLFWLDGKVCYGYSQIMNPGPYRLVSPRPGDGRGRIPAGPDDMWARIETGLRIRRDWEAIQTIKDRAERGRRMAAYLLPHTAPEG